MSETSKILHDAALFLALFKERHHTLTVKSFPDSHIELLEETILNDLYPLYRELHNHYAEPEPNVQYVPVAWNPRTGSFLHMHPCATYEEARYTAKTKAMDLDNEILHEHYVVIEDIP